jgi:filamentous hemagglutinin
MATLNFPTNPVLNQTYSFGGKTWVWNGQGWQLSAFGAINNIPIGNITPASGAFTTLSANTFTANGVTVLGNVTGANLNATGNLSVAGNVNSPLNVRANVTATNFTTAGTLTAGVVSATGNVTGAYFIGDGSQLTNLPGVNYSNANVANYLPTYSGNLPNLTGPVTTTGNLTGANVATSGSITATGNITGGNLRTAGSITATGNITGGNVATGNIVSANINSSGLISAVGNITGAYIFGNGSQLTGLPATYSNANVAAYLPTYTGNLPNLTGPVTTTGNLTGGNVLTSGVISAAGIVTGGNVSTGNITAGNVSTVGNVKAAYFLGDGSQLTNLPAGNYSNANVANYLPTYTGNLVSLTGPVTTTANVTGGNLRTAGSITATGNITGGNVATGNVTAGNVNSAGAISAVGNVAGAYILGDGSQLTNLPAGNYSNANVAGYLPTYTGNLVSLTGPVTSTSNITGGNLRTAGSITATGNITGGNVATGNVTAGNVSTAGNVTATYFLGDGSQLTNLPAGNYSNANVANYLPTYTGNLVSLTGPVTSTSNITGGNLVTAGSITATGNITGGNVATGNIVAGNVVSLGTVSAVGNIAGTYFIGNGAFLTGIASGNSDYSNANVAAYLPTYTGNLVSLTGPVVTTSNITGGNISTAGNVSGNNIIANNQIKIGLANIYHSNFNPAVLAIQADAVEFTGQIIATSDISGNNISAGGNVTGGNIRTAGYVSATGNIYAANFVGNVTGNITVPGATTQILFNDGGLANSNAGLTFNKTTQVLSVTGNIQSGNLRTAGLISATGNIAGQYFVGNGSLLTGIIASAGAAITNGSSNVTVAANGNVTVTVTGNYNVTTFATTGVYVAGVVSATGNVAGNYLLGNGAFITGLPAGYSNADVAAYLPTYSGNLPSLTGLVSTTGNVSGNYILGNGALLTGVITSVANINNGTSNITVVSSGGNISVGVGGTGNVAVFATTGEYITGELSATGNVTGNYFIGNGSQLTGVAASSVNANALIGNTLSSNVLYSSLTTVGNLANLSVVGNTTSGNINLTGGTLAFANASIVQTNPLDLSITGDYQISVKPAGGTYQWTFNNDGSLSGPTGLSTTGYVTATGNVTGGNVITTGLITASGNISGNNIFATTLVSVTGNVIAGNINTGAIRPVSGELTISTATGNLNLQPAGNIVLANTVINNLGAPQQDSDAATKYYVDNLVTTGFAFHQAVFAATNTDLATATGGTITYTQPNGVANGIGAKLTTTGSFNLIDTANVQTLGTRVLVKNEGNAVFNGVYTWANSTAIVRATDADQYGPDSTEQLSINDYFFVQAGNVNLGSAYVVDAPSGVITFGTSNIGFAQFSSSQVYTANTNAGLSLAGTVFNAKVDQNTTAFDGSGNIIVKASANLTTPNIGAATGASLSLVGNVISGNVLTGGLISSTGNIQSGNVLTGGSISATANVTGGNLVTSGLITATGNITGGNVLTGGFISATGNGTFGNISTSGSGGNITGANVITATTFSATGNAIAGNILTTGLISTSGNIAGGNILSNNYYYANGTPVPPGITYTANTAPPVSPAPKVTDQWYDTASDVLYEFINDGTNTYWVDTTSPAFAGGVVANVAISGTLVPIANVTYDIGTSTVYFRNTYTQNLYTNNRLTASNMPAGAVIQTVMSTSLGGSATTGTSYSDIALANVVIQPSSANSKVLIIATGTSSFTPLATANLTASTQLVRTAASLQIQEYSANIAGGGVGGSSAVAFSYLDNPNTTSPVTYKLQQKISNSSSTLTSSNMWIIAMEIAVP